jgi:hypothetical protein
MLKGSWCALPQEDTTNNTATATQVVCIGGSVEDWAVPTKQASGQVVGLCEYAADADPKQLADN